MRRFVLLTLGVIILAGASLRAGLAAPTDQGKEYIVAIDAEYAPYEFVDDSGQPAGFNVDVLRRIGELEGVTFRFVPMVWPEAVAGLEDGTVDLINMIQTPARAEKYAFSQPHSQIAQAIFVTAEAGITGLDDLAGHTIALQAHDISLEMLADRSDFERVIVHSKEEGLLMLNAGQVDAFFAAELPGLYLIERYKLKHVFVGAVELFPSPYGFATRRENTALVELLDQGLTTLKDSGELTSLAAQWFRPTPHPSSWLARHEETVVNLGILAIAAIVLLVLGTVVLERRVLLRTRALQESEARFRNFYENVYDVVYRTDYQGTITEVSPSLERQTGYRRQEVIGRRVTDFFANPTESIALNAALQKDGLVNDFEIVLRDKDGQPIPVSVSAWIVYDDHGRPVATEGVLRNIAARKALEAVRQRQLRFSNALNRIAETILEAGDPSSLLEASIGIVGETLAVDRALIYDVNFERYQAIGLCEWLNPDFPDVQPTLDTYPLDMFIGGAEFMRQTRHWLESHADQVNPHFLEDGSCKVLHEQMSIQSLLWYPFGFYEQGYYVIVLNQVRARRTWQEDEIAFLDNLSRQFSLALEKIRSLEATARRAALNEALSAAVGRFNRPNTVAEVLQEIGAASMQIGRCDRAAIYVLSPDWEHVRCAWSQGLSPAYLESVTGHVDEIPGGQLRHTTEPVLLPDVLALPEDALLRQLAQQEGYRSVGLWPLVYEGQTIAAIACYYNQPHRWNADEQEVMEALASQAAAALQNARLYEETTRRAAQFEALFRIAQALSTEQETTALLEQIVESARHLLNASSGGMYLYDPEQDELEVVVATDESIPKGLRLKPGEGLAGKVAESRQVMIVDDYMTWSGRAASFEGIPVRAVVEAPMLFGGELLGVLVVHERGESTRTFTQEDAHLLSLLASQAAAVLHSNRLLEKLRTRFAESEALRQAARVVTSTLNLREACEQILEQLATVVPYDSASVLLLKRDNGEQYLEIVSGRGWDKQSEVLGLRFPIPGDNPNTQVMTTGEPLVLNNVQSQAPYSTFQKSPHCLIRSWLGVPLIVNEEIIGMLAIDSRREDFFTAEHVRLATAYADHVAAAVLHARLYEEARRRASRAQHLAQAAAELMRAADFDAFWDALLHASLHILEADRAAIYLYDRQKDRLSCRHAVGVSQAYIEQVNRAFRQIPGGRLLTSTESVTIRDAQTDPATAALHEAIQQEGFHSVGIFPLVDSQGTFAAFTVYRDEIRPFNADEVIAGEMLGHLASYAYQNHSLLQAEQEQRRFAEALSRAGFVLSHSLNLDEVLDRLLEEVANVVPYDAACVMLLDADAKTVRVVRSTGYEQFGREVAESVRTLALPLNTTSNLQRMAESRQALFVPDTHEDPEWQPVAATLHLHSWLGAPLRAYGRLVGFFSLDKIEAGFYSQEHAAKLSAFSGQAAVAIENARLFQEVRHRAELMTLVHGLSRRVTTILDVDDLLQTAAEELHNRLGYLSVQFYLLDEQAGELEAHGVAGKPGLVQRGYRQRVGEGITGRAAAEGKPLLVDDVRQAPDFIACVPGIRSELVLPIHSAGRLAGVLNLESSEVRGFDEADIIALEAFCGQIGAALENIRLFQETSRKVDEQQILSDTATALRVANNVGEMIPILLRHAALIVGGDYGSIFLEETTSVEEAQPALVSPGWYGSENDWAAPLTPELRIPPGQGITGRVMQSGEPLITHDPLQDAVTFVIPGEEEVLAHIASNICLPLRTRERTVGVMNIGTRRHHSFSQTEIYLLQAIAEMAGNALQRARLHEQLEENYLQTVLALANAMDARDSYTGEHSRNLERWAEAVAHRLGCSEEEIETIRWGALLHDIGKIGVPDAVLLKPGPLTEEEWELIRRHPEIGARIVAPAERLRSVAPIIRAHQEKFDGSGYPDGLKGEEIPLGARILAVVDAYSAITDKRPYKEARSHEEAVAELRRCAGTHFDPRVVEAFLQVLGETTTGE